MKCSWLIKVDNGNPEPDFPEDCYNIVECGADLTFNEHGSFTCAAGHRHISFDDPARAEFELDLIEEERRAEENERWS